MYPGYVHLDVAPLKRLHNLVSLEFARVDTSEASQLLAPMGATTSLRSLTLGLWHGTPVHPLPYTSVSRITTLGLVGQISDALIVPGFNMERLMSLTLTLTRTHGASLSSEGLAAISRATGLTHFEFANFKGSLSVEPEKFGGLIAGMSSLQALSLTTFVFRAAFCFKAIGLLTALTRLKWEGGHVTNTDLEACLGLRQLRVLKILHNNDAAGDCITLDRFLAVAKLPELSTFIMKAWIAGDPRRLPSWACKEVRTAVNAEKGGLRWCQALVRLTSGKRRTMRRRRMTRRRRRRKIETGKRNSSKRSRTEALKSQKS
jgi:hypothetical protein